jgi:CHAT domain-containing protein
MNVAAPSRMMPVLWVTLILLRGIAALCDPSPAVGEPPAPQPAAAVQKLLDEAAHRVEAKDPAVALQTADGALATARAVGDRVGQAAAEEARARALEGLGQAAPAVTAWQAAAEAWAQVGDGPGQVGALLAAGLLQLPQNAAEAEALFTRALTLGQAETRRPLAASLALHTTGNKLYGRQDVPRARQFWLAALRMRQKWAPDSLEMSKSLYNLGMAALDQGDLGTAEEYDRRALAIEEKLAPDSVSLAQTLNNLAVVIRTRGDLTTAASFYRRALALFEKLTPDSMDVGRVLGNLGVIAEAQGDLDAAWDYFQRALAIFTKLEPNSLEAARMLQNMGVVTSQRGDLEQAAGYFRRALATQEKIAPGSHDVARTLSNLGNLAAQQGDFRSAQAYCRRALEIFTTLAPNSMDVAQGLLTLGNVAKEQGALAVAGARYREALAIQEKLAPGSLEVAASMGNLGMVVEEQGDLEAAADLFQRALALQEQWAPDSLDVANTLNNLGNLSRDLSYRHNDWGEMDKAKGYYERALAVQQKLAPVSLATATSMSNLAAIAIEKRDYATAERLLREALAMEEKLAPNSSTVVRTRFNLGVLATHQNDWPKAKDYYHRALSMQRKLAPDSLLVADLLFLLCQISVEEKNWRQSERQAREAWALVQRHAGGVTGDEARQAFGAVHTVYASRLIRAQLALGKVRPAFDTLEQGRARALQQMLTERQLIATAVPASLWVRYRAALAARDRAEQAISQASIRQTLAQRALATVLEERSSGRGASGPSPADSNAAAPQRAAVVAAARQFDEARSAYTQARIKADQCWTEIQRRAPRAFAPPLSLAQAEQALPDDLLLVAFVADPTESNQAQLFLLQKTHNRGLALSAYPIAAFADQLKDPVQEFRSQLTDPEASPATQTGLARSLFATLFPPAARAAIRKARRLLISPDGPLWELPFAALVTNETGPPHYLGAEKAITYTPSLTLFAQARGARSRRAPRGQPRAVVVGDPIFERKPLLVASARSADPPAREAGGERASLFAERAPPARLPETRREAEGIARLYGDRPLLGEEATEANLRQRLAAADVIHLATHGFLNPLRAMSSGVLLTVPQQEPPAGQTDNDGALQAWEIYSQLHLKAELVVLSACETGRGANVTGEGIIGLTRALQYAGARSIVASQWKVADRSTATLMVAFHQKLRQGLPKDEALRQAMAVVRSDSRTAQPYYWAPFCLSGDPEGLGRGLSPGTKAAGLARPPTRPHPGNPPGRQK